MNVDFTHLRAAIRQAAAQAFRQLRERHPEERFYAFALYTDEGARTVEPAANSEEAFQRKVEEAEESDPTELAYYRWSTGEWEYEAVGGEHFNGVYDELNADDRYGTGEEEPDDEACASFRRQLLQAMTGALADLDAEAFFGKGAEREKVTLFVSVSDSDEGAPVENESARTLNPEEVYQRFLERGE